MAARRRRASEKTPPGRKKTGKAAKAAKQAGATPRRRKRRASPTEASASSPKAEPPPEVEPIQLPAGRVVELPGRGRTFVREVAGPPDAPVVLLLHGWFASGGLNWGMAFESLAKHFRVVALDQRGHGRGIRNVRAFRLEDCADDAAALLEALEIDSAIVVGYSMGGPVGQLLWQRHPEKVRGLVLCATSGEPVSAGPIGRFAFTSLLSAAAGTARVGQLATMIPNSLATTLARPLERETPALDRRFALGEMSRHDLRMLFEAGVALGRYQANDWIRDIDVPTAIVVTTEDRAVIPEGQMRQALDIRDVRIFCVDDGHTAITDPAFTNELQRACVDVALRAEDRLPPQVRSRRRKRISGAVDALMGEA